MTDKAGRVPPASSGDGLRNVNGPRMSRKPLVVIAAIAVAAGGWAALRGASATAAGPVAFSDSIDRSPPDAAPQPEPRELPPLQLAVQKRKMGAASANTAMSLDAPPATTEPQTARQPADVLASPSLEPPTLSEEQPVHRVSLPALPLNLRTAAVDDARPLANVEDSRDPATPPPAPTFGLPAQNSSPQYSPPPKRAAPAELPAIEVPLTSREDSEASSEADRSELSLPPQPAMTASPEASPPTPRPQFGPSPVPAEVTNRIAADPHLTRYASRLLTMPETSGDALPRLPQEEMWWQKPVSTPLWTSLPPVPVDVSDLVLRALEHSPEVLAIRLQPEILRHGVCEERAAFDWTAFMEGTYDDISDPVGNTLTTGGDPRLEDRILASTSGFRRRMSSGADVEVSQRFGYQDNNSEFFLPTQQATNRLSLSFTQPLMNGRGEAYQQSRVVLAALDTGRAEDETTSLLQDHLLKVAEAYWDLYRSRCLYLQRRKVLLQAEHALETLEGRRSVDALPRQILRARSAVTARRSQIARAAADVRNHEAHLRLLVGDPSLSAAGGAELLPVELPQSFFVPVPMAGAAADALLNRGDIRRAVKDLRATAVRLGVAEHEMMPRLDLVLNGYLSGLRGDGQFSRSFSDQFTEGRPSFAAGLLFEVPLGRRAATARRHRRQMELVKATHDFEATVETTLTEVELAVREVETTYREMLGRFDQMRASEDEAAYLQDRWELMPAGGGSAARLLEDLLDAQERLADDEGGLTTAQVNYLLALVHLRRSTGTLLQFDPASRTKQPPVEVPSVPTKDLGPSGQVRLNPTPSEGAVR